MEFYGVPEKFVKTIKEVTTKNNHITLDGVYIKIPSLYRMNHTPTFVVKFVEAQNRIIEDVGEIIPNTFDVLDVEIKHDYYGMSSGFSKGVLVLAIKPNMVEESEEVFRNISMLQEI